MSTRMKRQAGGHNASVRRSAFTLVELLMVIAIIAILAAFLLPALNKSRSRARQIYCMNQLKQIGMATQMYVNDNNQYYPTACWIGSTIWHRTLNDMLNGTLSPLFLCPTRTKESSFIYGGLYLSYLANYSFFSNAGVLPYRVGKIRAPSRKIMIGPNSTECPPDGQLIYGTVGSGSSPGYLPWARIGKVEHETGANYLFGDAHAKFMMPQDALDQARYWSVP